MSRASLRSSAARIAFATAAVAAIYGCSAPAATGTTSSEALSVFPSGNVDTAAIVESTTMMLATSATSPLFDSYNEEDPFNVNAAAYAPTFTQQLATFDAVDGNTDWQPSQVSTWVGRMAGGNYLVIDTSMPCNYDNPQTYLEIERAQLTGGTYATCGGRMPNENAFDVTANFLVRGPSASVLDPNALHSGVEQATQQASNVFPYLADLN